MPRYNNDGRNAKFIHSGGGRGGGFNQGKQYNNDFKFTIHQNRGIQKKHRNKFQQPRDDDVLMGGDPQPGGSGQGGYGGRKSRKWQRKNMKHQEFIFGPGWHKILILDGTCLSKDQILAQLQSTTRVPFVPIAYSIAGTSTVFYVENRPAAQALAECSGKISLGGTEDKFLKLRITPSPVPPTSNFDGQCETTVRTVLNSRYNPQINTLSLSNFVESPELIREYYLPLFRAPVVIKLLNLMEHQLINLVGLDLSNNKLYNLDGFASLPKKAPNLKALNLGKNRIREPVFLDKIHGMQIIELILEENPICNKDKDLYISDVRKRFPKVIKLDGVDIPPPITFEVSEPLRMPDVRGSSYCNEEAKKVILAFWEQYMSLYDSNDRKPLHQAYHDTATMSMMCSYTQQGGHVSRLDPTKKLSLYLEDSRNLYSKDHVRDKDRNYRKYKNLHIGKLNIMNFLEKLPRTSHDPASIVIDMPVAVESFILFNISGLFKEREERNTPIRYFSRTFSIVPLNGGFVIVNEMLFITNPTTPQLKGAFKTPPPPAIPAGVIPVGVAGPSGGAPSAAAGAPRVFTDEEKRIMLVSFVQQSGMNEEWSRKCLEENEWNFDRSAVIFTELNKQGKIPPDAFTK